MQRKSLKKFLISAGLVCVLAPAALAASVIMNRGNGHAILGDTLQDAIEKVLLFGEPGAAPAAAANAKSAGKAQIPQGAGPYLNPAHLADLLRYNVDLDRLDLGDDHGANGIAAHGAPGDAVLAALADVLGIPGQQISATAPNGTPGGASGGVPGIAGNSPAPSGGGGAGSDGMSGTGGSGGSGSDALILPETANASAPGSSTGSAVTVIPLPATVWMLFAAFGALGMAIRRKGLA